MAYCIPRTTTNTSWPYCFPITCPLLTPLPPLHSPSSDTDREGHVDYEYISLGADTAAIFRGRSPVQMYHDLMANFSATVLSEYADIIVEVQVSLGPGVYAVVQTALSRYVCCRVLVIRLS